jgi:branched-chain amino acid transport system permease protein
MVDILLYSLAAATLGGLDSIKGAVVGGLGVAVITNLLATYVSWIGQDLKQATAMALIVIVLVFKPSGVFGAAIARRA